MNGTFVGFAPGNGSEGKDPQREREQLQKHFGSCHKLISGAACGHSQSFRMHVQTHRSSFNASEKILHIMTEAILRPSTKVVAS